MTKQYCAPCKVKEKEIKKLRHAVKYVQQKLENIINDLERENEELEQRIEVLQEQYFKETGTECPV